MRVVNSQAPMRPKLLRLGAPLATWTLEVVDADAARSRSPRWKQRKQRPAHERKARPALASCDDEAVRVATSAGEEPAATAALTDEPGEGERSEARRSEPARYALYRLYTRSANWGQGWALGGVVPVRVRTVLRPRVGWAGTAMGDEVAFDDVEGMVVGECGGWSRGSCGGAEMRVGVCYEESSWPAGWSGQVRTPVLLPIGSEAWRLGSGPREMRDACVMRERVYRNTAVGTDMSDSGLVGASGDDGSADREQSRFFMYSCMHAVVARWQ